MARNTNFEPLFGSEYSRSSREGGPVWGRGVVLKDGVPRPVVEAIPGDTSQEKAAETVLELDGSFSFAFQNGNEVVAAVDRVRSFPLFHAIHEGTLYLGDDPYRIQEKLGGRQIDPVALAEFYLAGYTTGDSTLDPRIRAIMAGETIKADVDDSGAWALCRKCYHRFQHRHDELNRSFDELIPLAHKEMEGAVERMIRVADGSLIAVPLSGGYDSRFILLTLKKLGYPHLMAFTYGVPGNGEAAVSKRVAEALGVPWHFVVYTPELWKEWLASPELARYQLEAEKMVSVAHIQDWPAVWELKKQGVFPEGTLFAPGHLGDILGGRPTRPPRLRKRELTKKSVMRLMWWRFYRNVSLKVALRESGLGRDAEEILRRRICARLECFSVETREGANSAYDDEFWRERSKFIVNSVRVYEFWGYRWWLPFCDKHLIGFWERVPIEWLAGRLYIRTVEELQKNCGLEIRGKKRPGAIRRLRRRISFPFLEMLIWRAYGRRKMLNNYMLGIQKTLSHQEFMRYLGDGGNINGYLAALHHRRYLGDNTS